MERWIKCDEINIELENCIKEIIFKGDVLSILIEQNDDKLKLVFNNIYSYKYTIEEGIIDRLSNVGKNILGTNMIFEIENSDYIKEFEIQSSGTRPMDDVKHYIIMDGFDRIVEILSLEKPKIYK